MEKAHKPLFKFPHYIGYIGHRPINSISVLTTAASSTKELNCKPTSQHTHRHTRRTLSRHTNTHVFSFFSVTLIRFLWQRTNPFLLQRYVINCRLKRRTYNNNCSLCLFFFRLATKFLSVSHEDPFFARSLALHLCGLHTATHVHRLYPSFSFSTCIIFNLARRTLITIT